MSIHGILGFSMIPIKILIPLFNSPLNICGAVKYKQELFLPKKGWMVRVCYDEDPLYRWRKVHDVLYDPDKSPTELTAVLEGVDYTFANRLKEAGWQIEEI